MPRPVMAFAIEAKAKGDEEKMGQAIRRLQEEDPTIDFHRDSETGEQILAGITQIHVEVIVDRMKERFGAEVELHSPHVPYREAIKGSAKAHARYKKQTGGRGQFADCHIEIRARGRVRPGRHRRRGEAEGDARRAIVLAAKDMERAARGCRRPTCRRPVMAFAYEAKSKGDEEKAAQAVRRLSEEDPTLDIHRDRQDRRADHRLALTQVHVEVIVDRMKRRFGAEIESILRGCPIRRRSARRLKAHGRYKKQTGGRGPVR